jgi:S-adenosylmethionine hydrolase
VSHPRARPNGIITLLTDFGLTDPFVGIMKGVILARCPEARVVDLTHGIAPQDAVAGAFWLERSASWFAPGTVHVAVVDPGVGRGRAALAAYSDGRYFIGPDNGLLAFALERRDAEVRAIDLGALGLPSPSFTFHGRDVFAPAAAELVSGRVRFEALGAEFENPIGRIVPSADSSAQRVTGEVVVVDHFGNLITNIEAAPVLAYGEPRIAAAGTELRLVRTYSEARNGEAVALINAFSVLELAVRGGNARELLGFGRRTPVEAWDAAGSSLSRGG